MTAQERKADIMGWRQASIMLQLSESMQMLGNLYSQLALLPAEPGIWGKNMLVPSLSPAG